MHTADLRGLGKCCCGKGSKTNEGGCKPAQGAHGILRFTEYDFGFDCVQAHKSQQPLLAITQLGNYLKGPDNWNARRLPGASCDNDAKIYWLPIQARPDKSLMFSDENCNEVILTVQGTSSKICSVFRPTLVLIYLR